MPSLHCFWDLGLSGTNQTNHDPRFLGVLNLFVREQLVSFINLGNRTQQYGFYGHPIEVARTSIALPWDFTQSPVNSSFHIEHVLDHFGVDRRRQSSFAMRILRAAQGLSTLNPLGFHMTATLELTIVEILEVEDLVPGEVMEQLESEQGRVVSGGASESAIVGLKEKVYDADDGECCSICLEEFQRMEKLRELPCSHVFHCPCIIKWLETNNSCPLCRCRL